MSATTRANLVTALASNFYRGSLGSVSFVEAEEALATIHALGLAVVSLAQLQQDLRMASPDAMPDLVAWIERADLARPVEPSR